MLIPHSLSRPYASPRHMLALGLMLTLLLWTLPGALPLTWSTAQQLVAPASSTRADYGGFPLMFEENVGQADGAVKFLTRGVGYSLMLAATEATIVLNPASQRDDPRVRVLHGEERPRTFARPTVLRMQLVGANADPQVRGQGRLPGRVNYLRGTDPAQWQTNVATYRSVEYSAVYPGIDMIFYGNQRQLEYDFRVAPGAEVDQIRLLFGGADHIEIDQGGNLLLHLPDGGQLQHPKPIIYQAIDGVQRTVAGSYMFRGEHEIGFAVGTYDDRLPLVIDPVLGYSAYLGSGGTEYGYDIAVDGARNAYITGRAASIAPNETTIGTRGGGDAFVAKVSADGKTVQYVTLIGGTADDVGSGIAVDAGGNAVITGYTASVDQPGTTVNEGFPTTPGAFRDFPAKDADNDCERDLGTVCYNGFIAKLNPPGNQLVFGTYYGTISTFFSNDIVLNSNGEPLVVGWHYLRAVQESFIDVAKFSNDGTKQLWFETVDDGGVNFGEGIAVDKQNNVYVTGSVNRSFEPTPNAFQTMIGGSTDAFVAKLSDGGDVLYKSFLGGSGSDAGAKIGVDDAGNVYITGRTQSTNFPTRNAAQSTYGGNGYLAGDAFVSKLNPNVAGNAAMIYSTFLGGSDAEAVYGSAIAVDGAGNAYLTGMTGSANFPITANATQRQLANRTCPANANNVDCYDAYIVHLNPQGGRVYSSFFGGTKRDEGQGIAVDAAGNVYLTGWTESTDLPRAMNQGVPTTDGIRPSQGGGADIFIARIDSGNTPPPPTTTPGGGSTPTTTSGSTPTPTQTSGTGPTATTPPGGSTRRAYLPLIQR